MTFSLWSRIFRNETRFQSINEKTRHERRVWYPDWYLNSAKLNNNAEFR